MSFSTKILIGLGSGLLLGLFLGEYAAVFQMPADAYIKLLQMTVLPYVTISIVSGLGSLTYEEARLLGVRVGVILLGLWGIAIIFTFLFPLAFPHVLSASFFSTSLIETHEPFDFVDLYIPSNPFHSFANNIVPAVVLFSLFLGLALIGVEKKQNVLDFLSVLNKAISRATRFIVSLTPYGLFAIAANAAGTLTIEQIQRLEVYLVIYVASSLLVSLWVLPGLISALTPIRAGDFLRATKDALITAFMTSSLFAVLPILTEASKALLKRDQVEDSRIENMPEVIIPASFNFPHTGKVMTISFILFAGWFADAAVHLEDYPKLALTGILSFFGSINVAMPYLLDLFRIPVDTFQLFLATGVINSHFGTLLAAVHTATMAVLGSCAIAGLIRFQSRRLIRYILITTILTALTYGGTRLLFSTVLNQQYDKGEMIAGMDLLHDFADATKVARQPGIPVTIQKGKAQLDVIRERGTLRVGYAPDALPYAFLNAKGKLVGFDVELAHMLALELGVRLQFVPIDRARLSEQLDDGTCDIVMSGIGLTTDRAEKILFSHSYLDETLAFLVEDHQRAKFATWEQVRSMGSITVAGVNLPYYVAKIQQKLPGVKLQTVSNMQELFEVNRGHIDAMLLTAERGSAWTLLHPEYSVVVPKPDITKVPLAYPLARHDTQWAGYVNTWIELKQKDGTMDALYQHWILGRNVVSKQPRWSILRNVLHWI